MSQKSVEFKQVTKEEAVKLGYKGFNPCNHYVVDMSHLKCSSTDSMNTISVKLPNGRDVTFCVMQVSPTMSNIDIRLHTEEEKRVKILAFENGKSNMVETASGQNGLIAVFAD